MAAGRRRRGRASWGCSLVGLAIGGPVDQLAHASFPRACVSASSSVEKIANVPSSPENSKIFRTLGRVQTMASRVPSSSLRVMPTSTPSVVESMNVVSERSTMNRLLPVCSASTSVRFRLGAVNRSSSPSTETRLVRVSSLR
jgi:hypothetical protein